MSLEIILAKIGEKRPDLTTLPYLFRRVNVSHWSDVNCPHGLKLQKTYILLLEPSRRRPDSKDRKINQSHLKASKIHRSAAIEFSQETEVSVLSSLGESN